jgi:hypothetical protein
LAGERLFVRREGRNDCRDVSDFLNHLRGKNTTISDEFTLYGYGESLLCSNRDR